MAGVGRKIYRIRLTADERDELEELVRQGRAAGWKLQRAQALLKIDEGDAGPAWKDARTAEAFGCTTRSLENWRKQAAEHGPRSLLQRKAQDRSRFRRLDGVGEARLVQLACSEPPEGHGRWSMQLLADELVALELVDRIDDETVRRTLQKTI